MFRNIYDSLLNFLVIVLLAVVLSYFAPIFSILWPLIVWLFKLLFSLIPSTLGLLLGGFIEDIVWSKRGYKNNLNFFFQYFGIRIATTVLFYFLGLQLSDRWFFPFEYIINFQSYF